MTKKLEGRVAIVTGGNSGIGEAAAHLFAKEGAKVALMARREPEGHAVQNAIRSDGGEATFIACDVSDSSAVDTAVAKVVATYGTVNILANNAGSGSGQNFPNEDDDNFDAVIQRNLYGTFYMSRAVWPHMIAAGGGAIVNISSLAATAGFNKNMLDVIGGGIASSSYYAAKAGVDAFTRYTAGIGGRHHIRVNGIRPGQVNTPGATNDQGDHWFKALFDMTQILDGPGQPDDIANAMLFLVSDDSRFITGEMLNVDGGCPRKL